MEDSEDDARYPPNTYSSSYHHHHHHQSYGSGSGSGSGLHRPKLPVRNASYANDEYGDEDEDEDEEVVEEEEEEEVEEEEDENENGVRRLVDVDVDENEEEEDAEGEEGDEDGDDDDGDEGKYERRRMEAEEDLERRRKRRKLRSSAMAYEFAPRVATAAAAAAATPSAVAAAAASAGNVPKAKSLYEHSPLPDWSEPLTFMLIDAWGAFLQSGKKSLRSDEWVEVAKKISNVSKTAMTDSQCRNRLHTLKKKYKIEKAKLEQNSSYYCSWAYFRKLDKYLSPPPRQPGLPCGLDSGEYVFMDRDIYLGRANGMDEMRDSPGNSESSAGDGNHSDGLPPKKGRYRKGGDENSSFRLLANSIQKFGEIYEKIENNKRQQMLELEKMRMEFHRDLELQKKQIMERAQAEIAKLQDDDDNDGNDDDEIDVSAENTSE
ncbi:hypothetical protein Syun_011320 [Stephania yunnanensis]|uniref:Myb/SANT-like DNA-binding domain-containing protein n=1 Tax=Stephania yunnanensis TaxID=152371 RepID=A0AAP0JYC1_9MAGN